jgi:hypothetical protein
MTPEMRTQRRQRLHEGNFATTRGATKIMFYTTSDGTRTNQA